MQDSSREGAGKACPKLNMIVLPPSTRSPPDCVIQEGEC